MRFSLAIHAPSWEMTNNLAFAACCCCGGFCRCFLLLLSVVGYVLLTALTARLHRILSFAKLRTHFTVVFA